MKVYTESDTQYFTTINWVLYKRKHHTLSFKVLQCLFLVFFLCVIPLEMIRQLYSVLYRFENVAYDYSSSLNIHHYRNYYVEVK